jgi:alkylated DNA repair dioxygenase AlkB
MNAPSGLLYIESFVSPDEEAALVRAIDAAPWRDDLKRRVQHYGYRYDYAAKKAAEEMFLGELPDWVRSVAARLVAEAFFESPPDQAIVNEYEPGQGISPHVDRVDSFGPSVASLSLLSACEMRFSHVSSESEHALYLAPRSLLVLREAARYEWRHSISGRVKDVRDGVAIPRSRRLSLTFRTLRRD